MASFLLRPKAVRDLAGIWNYTVQTWGESQADNYIHDLNGSFESLSENPEKGKSCDDIRNGYRKYYVDKHVVFYRQISKTEIEIIRVLHQAMDINRHL